LHNFIIHSAITSASIVAASLPVRAAIVAYTERNAFLAALSSSSSENYIDLATGATGNWFSHQLLWDLILGKAVPSVPGPLPVIDAAAAYGFSRRLRSRIAAARPRA
jgi:hypothetical protein